MAAQAHAALRYEPSPRESAFARDVIAGLTARPKRLPPKYFYDQAGAQLFEAITELPEYYPTRCELAILREHGADIARLLLEDTALVEFGSGSTRKARILLAAAPAITAYVPIDISAEMLASEAAALWRDHPRLAVLPVEADFTRPFRLPPPVAAQPRTGFFPGSTIGNFVPQSATDLLRHFRSTLGTGAKLLIGMDRVKPIDRLIAAYVLGFRYLRVQPQA